MKSCFLFSSITLACIIGVAHAADTYSRSEAERYIMDAEAAWAESATTNDVSVLQRIMADDCVWLLGGEIWSKARALSEAKKQGPVDFVSDHMDYAHVRFFGETAVVQGSDMWIRKDGGKGRNVWTDTWVRRNGQWQIVQAQDISVPTKP